jgi:hypothetical protein
MEQHPLFRLYVQLNDKVNNMASAGGNLSGAADLSDIIVRLKALEAKPTNDSEINHLKSVIQNLENANNELREKVNYLNKVDNLEARIYNLETEPRVNHETINERLNNLENGNYQERITNLVNRLNSTEQVAGAITDLAYRLNEVEKRPDLTERVNGLELTISTLHS